jgi:hypothetical protein
LPPQPMDSAGDTACAVGCPIRKSRDQRSLASPPGLSQRATSFIASQCQGIHQMPLPIRLITKPVACRAKPRRATCSHEDTLSTTARPPARGVKTRHAAGRRSAVHSLPLHPVKEQCRRVERRQKRRFPIVSGPEHAAPDLVEVNGIEPSTSCLQSRRSPN